MQFVHQPLAWGFLLMLVPLLIHLINLVRRRRVKWAAMDFLLQSYRKHRKWIWLKQMLLLAARMLIVALAVGMLAQWVTRQQWFTLLGNTATHHYVLLDDSFSMSDRLGGGTAFEQGLRAVGALIEQAVRQETPQKITLIRYSRAAGFAAVDATTAMTTSVGMATGAADGAAPAAASTAPSAASTAPSAAERFNQVPDFNAELIGENFPLLFEERRRSLEPTSLAVGPAGALGVLQRLLEQYDDEQNHVYLVSDFRERDWETPLDIVRRLREIDRRAARIQFIRCVQSQQPNLALESLTPDVDTRAAGVPLFVNISLRNYGAQPALRVPVKVRTLAYDPLAAAAAEPGKLAPQVDEPPTVLFDEIPPGETVTRRVQVYFAQPGPQVVEATLPDDAVLADNRRWTVIDLPANEQVLVIDGSPDQSHTFYLSAAFQPGPRANTGIQWQAQPAAFLRDSTAEQLAAFRAVYLLDVERLDDRAVENLETYVRRGGGAAIFLGEQVSAAAYTRQLYRDGQGLLPLPLDRADLLADELFQNTPDFEVQDHPIFSIFLGERNPFIRLVDIRRYFRPSVEWRPDAAAVSVLARLRNGDPLAVEKQFGAGRVVLFTSTLAPAWNNWAQDPSFVVALLRLQSYLAATGYVDPSRVAGVPLETQLDPRADQRGVAFGAPGARPGGSEVLQRSAETPAAPDDAATRPAPAAPATAVLRETARPGVYESWVTQLTGERRVRRYAVNVESAEGNLTLRDERTILARLDPLRVQWHQADQIGFDMLEQAGFNRGLLLLTLLVIVLVGEQFLAYSASYHPVRGASS